MRCQIVGSNLKTISKSIRLLSKYSEYVNLEASSNGIRLQGVNQTKTAMCEIEFSKNFFSSYEFQDEEIFRCKIRVKSLKLAFPIVNLDRITESCKIVMDPSFDKIYILMKAKYMVRRQYRIPYINGTYNKCRGLPSDIHPTFRAPAKTLAMIFKHFARKTEEATVWMNEDNVRFKSYVELSDEKYFVLPSTSFSLESREFTNYNYTENMIVTVNIKNIQAFLEFAVFGNQMISAYFQPDGKPIELTFHNPLYSSRVVIAVVCIPEEEIPEPPPFKRVRTSQNSNQTTLDTSEVETLSNYSSSIASNGIINPIQSNENNKQSAVVEMTNSNEPESDRDEIFEHETNSSNPISVVEQSEETSESLSCPVPSANESAAKQTLDEINDNLIEDIEAIPLSGEELLKLQNYISNKGNDDNPIVSQSSTIAPDSDEE